MKKNISYIAISCALFLNASFARAQFRPINPGPINPGPINPGPINPGPINPGPINPGPPPNPPTTSGQAFVVAVCAGTSDLSDDCLRRGELEATEELGEFYVRQYAKRVIMNSLTLRFPHVMSRPDQLRFLAKVEKQTLKVAEAQLKADVATLTPFRWDTEQDRQNKQTVVNETARTVKQWGDKARSEADKGSNWSHDWSSNSHKFNEGEAFKQLKHISIRGWTNQ